MMKMTISKKRKNNKKSKNRKLEASQSSIANIVEVFK
jgi:hypothetical protein